MNQRQLVTLSSNIVQNPMNNGLYISINTQSGKSTIDPSLTIVDVPKNNCTVVDETPAVESDKVTGVDTSVGEDIGKRKVNDPVIK